MAIYCLINSLHVHVITQCIDLRQKNGIYYLVNAKLKYLHCIKTDSRPEYS